MKARFESAAALAFALMVPLLIAGCDADSFGDDSPTRGGKDFEGSQENLVPGSRNHPEEDGRPADSDR